MARPRSFAFAFLTCSVGCATSERATPSPSPGTAPPSVTPSSAPLASSPPSLPPREEPGATPSPSASATPVEASSAAKPSGMGGPCWVSMVRYVDGAPSAEQKCAAGLACDYRDAVPDGPGRCRRR